jgi:hypothetical protein
MKKQLLLLLIVLPFFSLSQNWQQIGPEGGYFKEFLFHPSNSDIIYAGSDDGGGVYKSIDAGNNWTLTTPNFPNMTGWKIVLDENQPNIMYACDVYGRYGLLKSTDAGDSWSLSNSGLSSTYDKMVSGVAIKTADTLFMSTGGEANSTPNRPGNGIFKSYDGGITWVETGLQGSTFPAIGITEFGTVLAGSEEDGLYYSNDNGASWISHPDIAATNTIHEIQCEANLVLIASTEGVYLSVDWGITLTYIGLDGEFNFDACLHKTTPDVEVYSSTLNGLMHFSSGTGIWTAVAGSFFLDQLIIGIDSDGTNIYCGGFSNSPIIKSDDSGLSWTETATSPTATEINDIYVDPNDENRIFASLMGTYNTDGDFDRESIYASIDGGLNWTRKGPDAHGLSLTVNPLNSNAFYLGSFAQGVYKTTNNFDTYTQLSPNGKTVIDVIISVEDTSVIIISEVDFGLPTTDIKRSSDGGASFTSVSTIIGNRLMFSPNDNDTVYVATDDGVEISDDFGLTFNPWMLSGEDCLSLNALGSDLYVGTADGVIHKISAGVALDISGPWETPVEMKSILFEDNHLFVGLSGAEKDTLFDLHGSVWQSNDDGSTWTEITGDMTSTNIYGSNILESNGHELILGTYGGGLFKSSGLDLSVGIGDQDDVLFLVFPNPTTDHIIVNSIQSIIGLKYSILDIKGVVVKSGSYSVSGISTQNLDAGAYFIQINDANVRFVKN